MSEQITLNGEVFKMDEIKSMFLEPISGTNPVEYQICVNFNNGRIQSYDLTVENVASFNAWMAYISTVAIGYAPKKSLTNRGPK